MKKHLIVGVVLAVLLFSCHESKNPIEPPEEPGVQPLPSRQLSGSVVLPGGAAIQVNQMEVMSAIEKTDIAAAGTFAGAVVAGQKQQFIYAQSKTSGKPILLGYVSPDSAQIRLSTTTTALSLIMLNPMLFAADKAAREQMAQRAVQYFQFDELVQRLNQLVQTVPDEALDASLHPEIYQLAVEIGNATLKSFSANFQFNKNTQPASVASAPTIKNAAGDNVIFVNPRTVHYFAGIYNVNYSNRPPDKIAHIDAKDGLFRVQLGWPPKVVADPTETNYTIGQGQFYLRLEAGTRTLDPLAIVADTPEGYAFRANAMKGILFVIEAIVGWTPVGTSELYSFGGLARFSATVKDLHRIVKFAATGKPLEAFKELVTFVEQNAQSIGLWLWQEGYHQITGEFMQKVAGIARAMSLAFRIISAGNEQVPFIYDWVTAPPVVDYCINKNGVNLSECGNNMPPIAQFTVSPIAGDVVTVFTFDASATTDDIDTAPNINVRWDFDGDGNWDTAWSTTKRATHTYSQRESYTAFLEARDSQGLTALTHAVVNVSGGFASGKHIILFRDVLPWQNVRIEELLIANGITAGPGINQFEVLPSTQMRTQSFIPGESFIIIGNSQNQTFYNNYAANNLRFANFVYNGGTIFWEACDLGWFNNDPNTPGGDLRRAGVIIPGNVTTVFDYDKFNYVLDPSLPLVRGLPTIIEHNYASHESFTNLLEGTTIYMRNESSQPTLIEYKYGSGWVVATGQPIEHGYYQGKDLGLLFPRVVAYVLGKTSSQTMMVSKPQAGETTTSSARRAHGTETGL
ncbi:MAG: hypothetical protein ILNGONEN_02523 [Syntrophorhabdaceae bacterium]|nr:hypothetical protein [Syntrophorhabdaceae bacterium]